MNDEEFEEFIRRNPNGAMKLIVKAFEEKELLKIGNRSYVNAFRYPESRFDVKDLMPNGGSLQVLKNPDMLQPLSDPGKLFTDKYVIPPSSLIFKWADRIYDKKWWGEIAGGLTDAATVIQQAVNALTDRRKIYVGEMDVYLNSDIEISKDYVKLEFSPGFLGRVQSGVTAIHLTGTRYGMKVRGGRWNMYGTGSHILVADDLRGLSEISDMHASARSVDSEAFDIGLVSWLFTMRDIFISDCVRGIQLKNVGYSISPVILDGIRIQGSGTVNTSYMLKILNETDAHFRNIFLNNIGLMGSTSTEDTGLIFHLEPPSGGPGIYPVQVNNLSIENVKRGIVYENPVPRGFFNAHEYNNLWIIPYGDGAVGLDAPSTLNTFGSLKIVNPIINFTADNQVAFNLEGCSDPSIVNPHFHDSTPTSVWFRTKSDGRLKVMGIDIERGSWRFLQLNSLYDDIVGAARIPSRTARWLDDFVGSTVRPEWTITTAGSAGTTLMPYNFGELRLYTGATVNSSVQLDFGGNLVARYLMSPLMEVRFGAVETTVLNWRVYLYNDADNYIGFRLNETGAGEHVYAVCRSGGVETAEDLGVGLSTDATTYQIDMYSNVQVRFRINGELKATITDNIPTLHMEPHIYLENLEAANKRINLKYVLLEALQP